MSQVRIPYTSQKFCEMLKSVSERTKKRITENHYLSPNIVFSNELNTSANFFIKNLPTYFYADNILKYKIYPRFVSDISPAPLANKKIDIKVRLYYKTEETAKVPLSDSVEMVLMCRFNVDENGRGEFLIYDFPVANGSGNRKDYSKIGVLKDFNNNKGLDTDPIHQWTGFDQTGEDGGITATDIAGGVFTAESAYSALLHNHKTYKTTSGAIKDIYKANGKVRSARARSFANTSKALKYAGTAGSVFTTGMSYYDIATGNGTAITYVDAGVGTAGVVADVAAYYSGAEIPYVGELVAVYGTLRLTWDVFFNLGANYGMSKWYGDDDTKWFK